MPTLLQLLCPALRAIGLDPIAVLRDGGEPAREAAEYLRARGKVRLADVLDRVGAGLALDHVAFSMPVNTPERIAKHEAARDLYERARRLLSEA
jgi:hypothetical protein